MISQQIHLASRPVGMPTKENFKSVEVELPAIQEGEVLVKNTWMSVDPYMRGRMYVRESYIPPFEIDQVLEGGAIGEVIESRNENFPVGSKVSNISGWRTTFISDGTDLTLLPAVGLPDQHFLGVIGMPGLTGWVGLFKVAQLKPTDTVFVSAASGAVGSVVCQIAKLHGCRVIGSVGSDDKAEMVKAMGADAVINYKKVDDLTQALREAAPEGIDVYFENVGGVHLEAALEVINPYGRIPVCGMIADYNADKPQPGPSNLLQINTKKLTMQGFIVMDYWDLAGEFVEQMGQWIKEGKVKSEETVYEGLENAAEAFIGLFEGKNKGKMLVKI
ncbi:NADP-dependent oxidoreductase [Vibrio natriegens]|uniref:NADP-dependent oxidoreductase n=1 Tax=Vibrio natriegens NBRC 15636 = ATCC 14048 = DSM 759 TaxID=1219067 RepID=A0AAN0Y4R8_VIBNA|nr:NADP-dependent oxidoreductase [Vibrio natriegens]ALR18240.1 NADP-dependent oxidoreductase [Vibrio natriegens NBRC 15636 = ATCC 14048 = DSM 759]ANQ14188.1 NADP-dependent oxidoreductase [Vibrio natriegens NBRC 15636 = ATCC 14048 = DSM 759]EPM40225.1 NADP-dependent oxidoreductase [Vibrio natriegens NBRC 15636 = ATCC 14048 = DSM 759]MDX6028873.1 NADP-dependent oxidoreductase [Vibrio natriegens NBRC 15636 = ATCC 14048 = DSM 759]UUI14412.1 NADP-dependent oxidoreductase [Vibrio natriegens]